MSKDVVAFCMQISINVKVRPEKSAKETGVVSFLREVMGKKDTSLVQKGISKAKKEQAEIGNRTKVGHNKDIIRFKNRCKSTIKKRNMQENVRFFYIKLHKNVYFSVSKVHKIARTVISIGQKD